MENIERHISKWLSIINENINKNIDKFYIAYSGGIDSHVLLHAMHKIMHQNYHLINSIHTITLEAIHIHHGISEFADQWVVHAKKICAELNIPLHVKYVDIYANNSVQNIGIEGAARKARYAELQNIAGNSPVFLAHHANDQLETFILQWQRSSAIDGLVCMPNIKFNHNTCFCRPLLEIYKEDIIEYAHKYNLKWIDDDSNIDNKYARNHLRNNIMPELIEDKHKANNMLNSIFMLQKQKEVLDEYLFKSLNSCFIDIDMHLLVEHKFLPNDSNRIGAINYEKFSKLLKKNKHEFSDMGILVFRQWLKLHKLSSPSYNMLISILEQLFQLKILQKQTNKQTNKEICIPYKDVYIVYSHGLLFIQEHLFYIESECGYSALSSSLQAIYDAKMQELGKSFSNIYIKPCKQSYKVKIAKRPTKTLKHLFQENKVFVHLRGLPVICCEEYVIYHPMLNIN
jgi:tRNA(Ile)-lysidine synthetase-like protein